ncbi:hypothetical protein BDA99DRAFT_524423 [Phascolomyces articulosus]|uniref:Uncharacterized protein n=1 Tax=Phascolomyces articulosus TaxID=60185 RepID=A0AAD5JPN7_9FUNG|nr:hypothetical protein BDA99DRAFT_524423 [Phascolomyces articulosus]
MDKVYVYLVTSVTPQRHDVLLSLILLVFRTFIISVYFTCIHGIGRLIMTKITIIKNSFYFHLIWFVCLLLSLARFIFVNL